jgi:hypothetical protein
MRQGVDYVELLLRDFRLKPLFFLKIVLKVGLLSGGPFFREV